MSRKILHIHEFCSVLMCHCSQPLFVRPTNCPYDAEPKLQPLPTDPHKVQKCCRLWTAALLGVHNSDTLLGQQAIHSHQKRPPKTTCHSFFLCFPTHWISY